MASVVSVPGTDRPGLLNRVTWLIHHLFSFEAVFVLFLYSNEIKMFLGWMPGDETVILGASSILIGAVVVLREGVYVRGLFTVAAGILFIGWALTTSSWTPSIVLVDRAILYLGTFNLWCIAAGALIIANNRERVLRFLAFVAILALCLAVMGIWIYFTYGVFRRLDIWGGLKRVYLGWGYTVSDGTAVLLCLALVARLGSLKQLATLVLFGIGGFFLLVGGARAPLLGAATACLLAFVLNPPLVGRNRLELPTPLVLGILIFTVAGAYIAYMFVTGETTHTLNRFLRAFDALEDSAVAEGPTRARYWPAAWQMWLASPWIGNGLASFAPLFYGFEIQGAHPHNFILEILAEQGMVGLLLFLLFVWSGARHVSIRRLRVDPLLLAVVMICTTAAMQGLFAKDLAGGKKVFFMLSLLVLRPPRRTSDDEDEDEDEAEHDEPPPRRPRLRPARSA